MTMWVWSPVEWGIENRHSGSGSSMKRGVFFFNEAFDLDMVHFAEKMETMKM